MPLVVGGLLVVAVAVLLVVTTRGSGSTPSPAAPTPQTPRVATVNARTVETSLPSAQYDDDPVGTLRLEGLVLDMHEQPVGNATVVIDANPPREARTEADGAFAFDNLTPRTYRVAARTADGTGALQVRLGRNTELVTLRIRDAARIVVTVASETGQPVHGALVELRDLVSLTAVTDDTGHATLRGVGVGLHVVKASAEGHASAFGDVASTGEAGAESRIDLVLRAGASVAGTVVDPSGAPIEGARVLPESLGRAWDHYDSRYDAVLTDAKGRWRLTGLPRETMRVRAYHAQYAPGASSPLPLAEGGDRSGVTVMLERGAHVRGRVVDTADTPVAGAEVRISADTVLSGQVRRVAADADGKFDFVGLPRGVMYMVAASEDAISKTTRVDLRNAEPPPVELRLDQSAELSGIVVTTAGAPVSEARVSAVRAPSDNVIARVEDRLRGNTTAIAGGDGRFRIRGLPQGTYLVRAIRPGSPNHLLEARLGVPVETGAANVRIVVDELSAITGKVAYADGKPVPRFAIQLGVGPLKWFTPSDGAFRVEDVPAGKQFLRISGPDFPVVPLTDVAIEAGHPTDVGTITVPTGRTIAGTIVDKGGHPVAGATIALGREIYSDGNSLVPYPDPDILQAVSGANGRFAIRGVGSGSQQIVADHETAGRSIAVAIPPGAADSDLTLTLQQPSVVQGLVRSFGKPVEAVVVMRASGQTANTRMTVRTGPDGSYRFDRVAPDRYMCATVMITARRDDSSDGKIHQLDVPAGQTVTYDVDLTPTGVGVSLHIASPGNAVKFAYTTIGILDGKVNIQALPKTIGEARMLTSQLESLQIREGMVVANEQIAFVNVPPGHHVACAAPLRGDPTDPSVIGEMAHHAVDWPIFCKWFDVAAAPDPQQVTVDVEPYTPKP